MDGAESRWSRRRGGGLDGWSGAVVGGAEFGQGPGGGCAELRGHSLDRDGDDGELDVLAVVVGDGGQAKWVWYASVVGLPVPGESD